MAKTKEVGYRVPLFDRIFKPEIITLPNGNTVARPRSRMPLIAIVLVAVVWASVLLTGFDHLSTKERSCFQGLSQKAFSQTKRKSQVESM